MFAERDVESLVNEGLVYIVIIWQQGLIELALIIEDDLKKIRSRKDHDILEIHSEQRNMQNEFCPSNIISAIKQAKTEVMV